MKRPRATMYDAEVWGVENQDYLFNLMARLTPFRLRKIAKWLLKWADYLEWKEKSND